MKICGICEKQTGPVHPYRKISGNYFFTANSRNSLFPSPPMIGESMIPFTSKCESPTDYANGADSFYHRFADEYGAYRSPKHSVFYYNTLNENLRNLRDLRETNESCASASQDLRELFLQSE